MAISEQQLEIWSHQGSKVQSANTYQTIRAVLDDPSSPYYNLAYSIFLQGSYGNDTNVYADSDVDIVICLTSVYYDDLLYLEEVERESYRGNWSEGGTSFSAFKTDVLAWLKKKFGNGVKAGNKAIFIPGNGVRRDADVLVCVEHRTYTSYKSISNNQFWEGVCFWTSDGAKVVNYPRQHRDNCEQLNGATSGRFKPSVRVMKNMRNAMIDHGYIKGGMAPSYFLEGMLSNVPTQNFVTSRQQTFENYMRWLETCATGDLTCANGIHYLLRDGHSVCWNVSDFNAFRAAATRYFSQP